MRGVILSWRRSCGKQTSTQFRVAQHPFDFPLGSVRASAKAGQDRSGPKSLRRRSSQRSFFKLTHHRTQCRESREPNFRYNRGLSAGCRGRVETMSLNVASISFQALVAFVASRGIGPYIRQHFLDTTFRGLYHANAFDMALLIPYFVVLILLATYGIHRYTLGDLYYKNKKNQTTESEQKFSELPRVTVQLPIFNEQFVIDRLLQAVCRLDYPREKLEIQVLDDSTDETVDVARGLVEHYDAQGHPITYHHRSNRAGFKAGALHEGLKSASGEFVAIFDADFVPPPDF